MGRDVHLDGRQHAIDHLLDLGLEAGRREERIELAVADEGRGDRVGVAAVQRRCEEVDVLHLRLVCAVELAVRHLAVPQPQVDFDLLELLASLLRRPLVALLVARAVDVGQQLGVLLLQLLASAKLSSCSARLVSYSAICCAA